MATTLLRSASALLAEALDIIAEQANQIADLQRKQLRYAGVDTRPVIEQIHEVLSSGEHLTPVELGARLPHIRRNSIINALGDAVRDPDSAVVREDTSCGRGHYGPYFRCYLATKETPDAET